MKMFTTIVESPKQIVKRDGTLVPFDYFKIRQAIAKANANVPSETLSDEELDRLTAEVVSHLDVNSNPGVEDIQDIVELTLMENGSSQTAKVYILYRAERAKVRKQKNALMETFKRLSFTEASATDMKRENANIDGNTAMGMMLKYGSEASKSFIDHYVLPEDMAKAHAQGDIHIHDKDFYLLTETCCQIDLQSLFRGGFSTGHGFLREPQSIESYAALACIALQANQNEMHGGQSIPNFENVMAEGVQKTCRKHLRDLLEESQLFGDNGLGEEELERLLTFDYEDLVASLAKRGNEATERREHALLELVQKRVQRSTYQAMQSFIHNLNTMHSRAGAQVPFTSINYGTGTSHAARLVMRELLRATEDGLGNGETPIFPVQIFKVKDGINSKAGDPNYDLFKQAIHVSARRLFPNFSFLDAPFNLQYYRADDDNTEVAYMGCRTRVMGNIYDPNREVTKGRGNLSFTSINLPRLGIEARGSIDTFFSLLDKRMDLVFRQLRHRFEIQKRKLVLNYPFLMGQGIWLDSNTLERNEEIERVLRHGTLSIGFIGLAETLVALTGKHHGESEASQELGLQIVSHMRKRCDERAREEELNYTLLATPAEGLSGRFVKLDQERYGVMENITNHEYYTNSFHIPVYYKVSAYEKIALEAPYHTLTNAGHITYIELDGDPSMNLSVFEDLILYMKDAGIGYGSINHPLDRDPKCGYTGVIGTSCPQCGRKESKQEPFERIRRITGYLVGTLERFNDAKRAEVGERVKHA
ncbi:MAG: anaerobic ribonucleoside triphosphate reductase [Firmicutes bacterium]|nr:anaerobic ribonucleoside triphosphate reductase [Bacillota bacterium]